MKQQLQDGYYLRGFALEFWLWKNVTTQAHIHILILHLLTARF